MPKGYLSNRQKNFKIGIVSYTENNTVLEVIGKVGIGTTNSTSKLTVVGDTLISGVVTATKFSGDGSLLTGITASGNIAIYATASGVSTSVIGGIGSITSLSVSGVSTLTQISAGGTVGAAGSILSSTGSGLAWIPSASTTKSTSRSVATAAQTSFSVNYTVGYIDVFLNGSKLDSTEYTASNGTSVILTESASANDVLEFVTFSNIALSSGTAIIDDTTTNANRYLTYTDAISGGISTLRVASTELTFNPGTNTFTTGNIVGTALNISGVSTLGTVSNLNVTGVSTLGTVSNLNVTGVSTLGTVSSLNVTGVSTLGTVSSLNVTGVSTLTQISAGGTVGTAGSVLSSTGSGIAWIPAASGGGNFNELDVALFT